MTTKTWKKSGRNRRPSSSHTKAKRKELMDIGIFEARKKKHDKWLKQQAYDLKAFFKRYDFFKGPWHFKEDDLMPNSIVLGSIRGWKTDMWELPANKEIARLLRVAYENGSMYFQENGLSVTHDGYEYHEYDAVEVCIGKDTMGLVRLIYENCEHASSNTPDFLENKPYEEGELAKLERDLAERYI